MTTPPPQGEEHASSILVQTANGHALLDPYTTLLGPGISIPWKIKCSKLPLSTPYDGSSTLSAAPPPKKKRRKATREISQNEQANIDLHDTLREWLLEAIEQVRQAYVGTSATRWCSVDRLHTPPPAEDDSAREPIDLVAWGQEVAELKALDSTFEETEHGTSTQVKVLEGPSSNQSMTALFEQVQINDNTNVHTLKTPAASFLIPPRAGFLMADMSRWYDLLSNYMSHSTFNVVLLDPPWRSKSVRRSANYEEMDMYDLYKIRLNDLLQETAKHSPVLVGVWVTNHTKCRRFVRDKLLPAWGVTGIADWYWVKITAGEEGKEIEIGGLPVWSFDGPSPRRCYEGLMLGYYNPNDLPILEPLPDKRAFLSVPLEHSRKPLVLDLLKPFIHGQGTRVLEMFARFTPSGVRENKESTSNKESGLWLSVGNEPLKYNEIGVQLVEEKRAMLLE